MLLAAFRAVFAISPSPCDVAKMYSLSANNLDRSVKVEDRFESMLASLGDTVVGGGDMMD